MNATFPLPRRALLGGASLAVLTLVLLSQPHDWTSTPIVDPEPFQSAGADARPSTASSIPDARRQRAVAEHARAPNPAPSYEAEETATVQSGAASTASQDNVTSPRLSATKQRESLAPFPASPADADAVFRRPGVEQRDRFEGFEGNPVHVTAEDPVSTFSIDVDTASYAVIRSSLMNGVLPPVDAVRVEEMVNYFSYAYPAPDSPDTPFATQVSISPTPWNPTTELLRIGIKGYELQAAEKPRSNLVFLLDTSGSMNAPDKLPLLLNSLRLMLGGLAPDDTVSIVAYAGSAGTVLEPTPVREKTNILAALERLQAGGSTAGGEGIRQAYRLAEQNYDPDGINRVILATDGDFNVGITSSEQLEDFVARKRETGIYLSVLGFGRGNYNDQLMQTLAQNGNGNAAYIDTLSEARKVLVDEAASTLFPIAEDVKIQVEFNPAAVSEYRLIGYETRALNREDFNNDRVDAGEIGAGHTVTALYEITPATEMNRRIDGLRYSPDATSADPSAEVGFLKIRFKQSGQDASKLIERAILPTDRADADINANFAIAVAAFGELLRGGAHAGAFTYEDVLTLATRSKGEDPYGYRAEFINLVRLAQSAAAMAPLPK